MMQSHYFSYEKPKVIQALRYHFLMRREIKMMMVVVNVFAILSAVLFYFKIVSPLAFLIGSSVWLLLMVSFWFLLPLLIYRQSKTFTDAFRVVLTSSSFTLENDRGSKSWEWASFSHLVETPYFFHLYFNTNAFLLVPKGAFEAINLTHEARTLLREHIKGPYTTQG